MYISERYTTHLKIAILNLMRNKRRTLSSLISLILALTTIIMFEGFAQSMYQGMRESMIHSQLGHIQVSQKGFAQFGALQSASLLLSEDDRLAVERIAGELSEARVVTSRLETDALITTGDAQMSVQIVGIDPDKEAVVSSAIQVLSGSGLFPFQTNGILLGKELAGALGAEVGDTLTLLGSTVNQGMNVIDVEVVGTVTTGVKERDLRTAYTNTALVENFILTKGASRVVILLSDTEHTNSTMQTLENNLANYSENIELRSWSDLASYYHQVVGLFDFIFLFIKIILFIVAGFTIFYTLSLNVIERTNEIGVIRALGGSRSEVCTLFVMEGFILGVLGGILGIGFSLLAASMLGNSGWMMPTPPGSTVTYPLGVLITFETAYYQFLIIAGISLVGSFIPSFRASNFQIAKALDHV